MFSRFIAFCNVDPRDQGAPALLEREMAAGFRGVKLLPVNLALFYLARERGMVNPRGLAKFLFILVQPLTVYFLFRENPQVFSYLRFRIVDLALLDSAPLHQPVLLVYVVVLLLFLFFRFYGYRPAVHLGNYN